MTTSTSVGVDLDQVLVVADDLRRICHRAIKLGVLFSTFKQESWVAALAHVQDFNVGRQPRISSDGAIYRLLAYCPPRTAWRWEHLEGLRDARTFDGRGDEAWRVRLGPAGHRRRHARRHPPQERG